MIQIQKKAKKRNISNVSQKKIHSPPKCQERNLQKAKKRNRPITFQNSVQEKLY